MGVLRIQIKYYHMVWIIFIRQLCKDKLKSITFINNNNTMRDINFYYDEKYCNEKRNMRIYF